MTIRPTLAALCLALSMACITDSCTSRASDDSRPVPRRTAYPRLPLPDTALVPVEGLPVALSANAAATVTSPRPGWVDIAYPTLGATAHITCTPVSPATIRSVHQNRLQRLILNTGDRSTTHTEFTSAADTTFHILMARTEATSTPLQLLATDGSGIIVSGAVYFADPAAATATDSIRPAIDAIERDLTATLTRLRHADNH